MSRWNHAICEPCWELRNGDKEPVAVGEEYALMERCCFCGKATRSGIYVRGDPAQTPCKGEHAEGKP